MKPCTQAYCPNAAGPSGVCDECRADTWAWKDIKPKTSVVKNETGKPEYILTHDQWRALQP